MTSLFCRNCHNKLQSEPVIIYHDMPKSAQHFPDSSNIESDKGTDLILYECSYCGLIQLSGSPVPYYRDVIRAVDVSKDMLSFRENQFSKWILDNNLTNKRIIEIGACRGEFMTIMGQTGAKVYGLEHSHESAEEAKSHKLNVIEGYIENDSYIIPHAPFDGFYTLNFLEHAPEPGAFLRGIYNNLSENAVGIVEVPNFDMTIQNNLFSELIQDHLSYFTVETLKNSLTLNGFSIISIDVIWHDYIISAQVRKRSKSNFSGFYEKQNKLKHDISNFLLSEKKAERNVAVWGAGHQALAYLSLLDMADSISCVIDSANFKQGKYTPATHIKIVSPDVLNENKIDTIIVMAGSYNNEVISGIIETAKNIKIATLGAEGFSLWKE